MTGNLTEYEWKEKFKNPNINDWIEDIEAVPMLVMYVPAQSRTFEVFLASVLPVSTFDTIVHFTHEQAVKYLVQMHDQANHLFPNELNTVESCMAFYADYYAGVSFWHTTKMMKFYAAEAALRTSKLDAVVECVDEPKRAMAFRHLFGQSAALKHLPGKYRRFLLESDLSL